MYNQDRKLRFYEIEIVGLKCNNMVKRWLEHTYIAPHTEHNPFPCAAKNFSKNIFLSLCIHTYICEIKTNLVPVSYWKFCAFCYLTPH